MYVVLCAMTLSSCEVDKYNLDPNRPTVVEPQAILPNLLFQSFKNRYPWQPALTMRHTTAISDRQAYQTYEWSNGSWDEYNLLRDVQKMMDAPAAKIEHQAIGHILRSYHFFFLTRMYGDIPYQHALAGGNNAAPIFLPEYDSQKDVFIGILKELEEANALLSEHKNPIEGDILYHGDMKKWQKMANSLSLKVLMSLSDHSNDPELDVKDRFKTIVSDPGRYPIFENENDEIRIAYRDYDLIRYPMYQDFNVQNKRFMGKTLVDLMKRLEDHRLFYYALPAQKSLENGLVPFDFDAYQGIDGSLSLTDVTQQASTGNFSRIDVTNYTNTPIGKPSLAYSYAEFMLILEEAKQLKWISNTDSFYETAVRSSFDYYGMSDAIPAYLTKNPLSTNTDQALQQIYEQRYILFFHQADFEAFFDYHRTGYPIIKTGNGQATKAVPFRMMYPLSEKNTNKENYNKALQQQGMSEDTIMAPLWINNTQK